jgi:NAD(P)-dependent dehydrogenase (short-subunit alcohol dehydrogenase family)
MIVFSADMTPFERVGEAVRAVHRHYGRVDGLINNARRSYAAALEEIDPALFDEIFHLKPSHYAAGCGSVPGAAQDTATASASSTFQGLGSLRLG